MSRKDYSSFKDNVGIVVFNEMFFGKKIPYIESQYKEILEEFKKISDQIADKLFCINVLGERKYNISPEYRDFVTKLVIPKKGEESRLVREDFLFDDDETQISNYVDNAYTEGEHLAIENASFVFYHGEKVAFYRKGSYFCESDWYLDHGVPYIFGNGETAFSENSDGKLLSEYLSIQICRDVLCGIGECSPRGLLHIFQSNSLYFRADDIPKGAKTVVHADPVFSKQNGDFYCKRMVFNMDEEMFIPLRWENGGCPVFFLRFYLGKATYDITIRDITQELLLCHRLGGES